jgi:hypothetical protein
MESVHVSASTEDSRIIDQNYWCFAIWKARGTLNYCRSELLLLLLKDMPNIFYCSYL